MHHYYSMTSDDIIYFHIFSSKVGFQILKCTYGFDELLHHEILFISMMSSIRLMTINSLWSCGMASPTAPCDSCLPKDPDRYLMSRVAKDIRSAQSQSADLLKSLLGSIKTDWRPASTWEALIFCKWDCCYTCIIALLLYIIIVSISLVIPMDVEFLIVQEMFLLIDIPVLCSWIASPCRKKVQRQSDSHLPMS